MMRIVGSVKAADVLGVHAHAPKPSAGVTVLGVRVSPGSASCGVMVADVAAGAVAPVPARRSKNVRGRSRVGKATPAINGASGSCQGACESAKLVRVRYERHSLLFDRSWRESTPPPLPPSERARTRQDATKSSMIQR